MANNLCPEDVDNFMDEMARLGGEFAKFPGVNFYITEGGMQILYSRRGLCIFQEINYQAMSMLEIAGVMRSTLEQIKDGK